MPGDLDRAAVRDLLATSGVLPGAADLTDTEPFALDSLALLWLLHLIEDRYAIRIDPDDPCLAGFTSLGEVHDVLAARLHTGGSRA